MAKAIFPGSFDPPTFGHLNIIERARAIFEEIHVVIAVNRNKKALFLPEERFVLLENLAARWDNISVHIHDGLIADYAAKTGIDILIRGIRNIEDFMYEFDISVINKALYPKIETIFIPTEQRFFVLNSSSIKEVAAFGGDTSSMAPPIVVEALKKKFLPGGNP
ncbi:MAG: pantetheine-phosphate adenylyltransferase [Spirochaetaceae bacterium]|jgi:pantetheine-phosphate adenylyltransferase|nr:pantetheine-phosphate adenylyltransferase [Spirochaetaceae bacterium]